VLQTLLGYPALQAGITMAPRGVGSFLAMPVVGFIMVKFDARKLLALGMAVAAGTLIEFSRLSLDAGYWNFFWPQIIMGISLGFLFVPLTTTTMDPIPKEVMGNATSLFNLVRNLGGSIGISAVETLQVRRTQTHINVLGVHVNRYNPQSLALMDQLRSAFVARGSDVVTATQRSYAAVWGMVERQAAMLSYNDVFRLLGIMFFAMIPFILFMKEPKGRGDRASGH
jgi:MFS transporter, DHA2 family, multidrug resistance protein